MSLVFLTVWEGAELLGAITKRRKFEFEYALFERKPGPLQYVLCSSVKVTSDQSAQAIWDAARDEITSHPKYGAYTGHHIRVYQVGPNFVFGLLLTRRSPEKHLSLHTISQPATWTS